MTPRTTGLVLGAFYPPHAGHLVLIETLAEQVDDLDVCVLASEAELVPLASRVRWLTESCPGARVLGGMDEAPTGDTDELWDAHLAAMADAGTQPTYDVVATGEWYGAGLAARLGARLLAHDPGRALVPVSGTAVRADVAGSWSLLPAAARADLVRRVVVVGAESTGTTTLARDLAEALGTVWVPEFGRAYSAAKGTMPAWVWSSAEFAVIAREQAAQEDAAARLSGPVLICDTDVLATAVWHERYVGGRSAAVEALAGARRPDLYLLTSPAGVAWEDDGMRDGEHLRLAMHERFRAGLAASGVAWREVVGGPAERLAVALDAVAEVATWSFTDRLPDLHRVPAGADWLAP